MAHINKYRTSFDARNQELDRGRREQFNLKRDRSELGRTETKFSQEQAMDKAIRGALMPQRAPGGQTAGAPPAGPTPFQPYSGSSAPIDVSQAPPAPPTAGVVDRRAQLTINGRAENLNVAPSR